MIFTQISRGPKEEERLLSAKPCRRSLNVPAVFKQCLSTILAIITLCSLLFPLLFHQNGFAFAEIQNSNFEKLAHKKGYLREI